MYLTITDFIGSASVPAANHLTLTRGNVLRLPHTAEKIRVLSGCAWLTLTGQDHILIKGENMALPTRKDSAIVMAMGKAPLVLEVTGK